MGQAKRLASLGGLKAVAVLLVFWWHSPLPNPSVDLGARCCEFFFVVAGFLFAYNRQEYVYMKMSETVGYIRRKIVKIYPIYFLTFLAEAILLVVAGNALVVADTLIKATLSLLMLQSWSPNESVFWAFNGASWFIASLMFCYLIGCLTIGFMSQKKRTCWLLALFVVVRYAIEFIQIKYGDQYFIINMHVNPMIRALEFSCGMATGRIMQSLKERTKVVPIALFTATEVLTIAAVVYAVIRMNGIWTRAAYVYLFCILVFVFSFDGGVVSRFLSIRILQWFGSIQLEFYLVHTIVCKAVQPLVTWSFWNWYIEAASICFCVTLGCIVIYRFVFRKPMERGMERGLEIVGNIIG